MADPTEFGIGSDEHPAPPAVLRAVTPTEKLGLPVYAEDSRAPPGIYWNETGTKLKYKDSDGTIHAVGSGGSTSDGSSVLSDSGSDTSSGGNLYQFPASTDSLDFQGSGEVQSLAALNGGGPVTDGDGNERRIWIIANGASDPADATAEDIIFEESS